MREDAAELVAEEVQRLRGLTYEELLVYEGHALHHEVLTTAGQVLIRETQVWWEDRKDRMLRVMVDVWDPNSKRFIVGSLAVEGFLRTPDGFVGE